MDQYSENTLSEQQDADWVEARNKWLELVDSDLDSQSCLGMGVKFPQLWDVIKRYILRGDEFYQQGGLSVLAAIAWRLPLDEAADVLEQYFEKWDYRPGGGARGGVDLDVLRAVYSVATAAPWDSSDVDERRVRMLRLLKRYESMWSGDSAGEAEPVTATIEAIRVNKPGFEPRYPSYDQVQQSDPVISSNPIVPQSLDTAAMLRGFHLAKWC